MCWRSHEDADAPVAFQFPSNGKAHSDTATVDNHTPVTKFQFPSNGRLIQTDLENKVVERKNIQVSIPFKREGSFRREFVTHAAKYRA